MAQPPAKNCPLCDQPLDDYGAAPPVSGVRYRDTYQVRCRRCGVFIFAERAVAAIQPDQRHLLSAACRKWAEGSPPAIIEINIEKLVRHVPRLTVSEKLDSLLQILDRTTAEMGDWSSFAPGYDYPLLALRSPREAITLGNALVERGYAATMGTGTYRVTVSGYEALDAVRQSGRESSLAFVAMWLNEETKSFYEDAIRPAIRGAGYEPLRIDQHEHFNRIDDEIIDQIRRSRFMVADFTGQRHGVYFEAGQMIGMGRNVIWMCKAEELHECKLHFDVRQYNFIDWESTEDARTRLYNRILRLEGEGPKNE